MYKLIGILILEAQSVLAGEYAGSISTYWYISIPVLHADAGIAFPFLSRIIGFQSQEYSCRADRKTCFVGTRSNKVIMKASPQLYKWLAPLSL
jgi:hypothetical protein